MYDTILLPTDGSDHSVRAAEHGVALARWFDATVHVISVVDVTRAGGVFSAGGVGREFVSRLEDAAREAIATVEETVDGTAPVRTAVLEGNPPDEILDYAADRGVDLIAMGTHGRTGLNRYVAGSVTERVVRLSEVPVLTARATGEASIGSYDDVLVPTDGSDPATAAIDHGIAIATAADARLHAVNVVDVAEVSISPDITPPTEILERVESDGRAATDEIATRAREAGLEVETAVRKGLVSRDLLGYVDENDVDMIAMGTHGRTGIGRYLLGSTTERMIRHAAVPVLAVHAGEGSAD
jgi:nucleotide-binding universal stress UspA family protein